MKVHLGKLQQMINTAQEQNFRPQLFLLSQPALDALLEELEFLMTKHLFIYDEQMPTVADEQQIMGVPFRVTERTDEWVELISTEVR